MKQTSLPGKQVGLLPGLTGEMEQFGYGFWRENTGYWRFFLRPYTHLSIYIPIVHKLLFPRTTKRSLTEQMAR